MIGVFRDAMLGQMLAALRTLQDRVETCPDEAWHGPVANHTFCQVVFHTLFFVDCYLGPNPEHQRTQPFHAEHPEFFRTYEEMEDKKPELLYDKPGIGRYMEFCRAKAAEVIGAETDASLAGPSGFPWLAFTRAELHLYNVRHVQHHAAQLILRRRLDAAQDARWHKSGWGESG